MSQTGLPSDPPARPSTRANKRVVVRYRCAPATIGKLYVSDDHEYQLAWALDLSQCGIGLVLTRPVPAGKLIAIHLKTIDQRQTFELPGRVAHCTQLSAKEWSVGCEFVTPLTADDLERLL